MEPSPFQFQHVVRLNGRVDLADEMTAKLVETISAFHRSKAAMPPSDKWKPARRLTETTELNPG